MKVITRKKSGEVVKPALRCSSHTSSTTATPTKTVRFNEDLEQVRHFFQADRIISIGVDSSAINGKVDEHEDALTQPFPLNGSRSQSAQWEATVINFSRTSNGDRQFVQFDSIYLSIDNRNLIGAVNVANIAFEKQVAARFTLDGWQTISEVTAEYKSTGPVDTNDQFRFTITLPAQADLRTEPIQLCVRYRVNGQEFWDNNSGKNYLVNFNRKLSLLKFVASEDCDAPRIHLNGLFSDRYSFATSLRATSAPLATRERTRCVSEPTAVTNTFHASSTPRNQNGSKLDPSSPAYHDMIRKLCYFRPECAIDAFDGTKLSQTQSFHSPDFYSDQSYYQVPHIIDCF